MAGASYIQPFTHATQPDAQAPGMACASALLAQSGSLPEAVAAYPFKVEIREWQQWPHPGLGVDSFQLPGAAGKLACSRPIFRRIEAKIYRAVSVGDADALVRRVQCYVSNQNAIRANTAGVGDRRPRPDLVERGGRNCAGLSPLTLIGRAVLHQSEGPAPRQRYVS